MNWLQKTCKSEYERAVEYFDIGHGDYYDAVGFEPKYIVWAYIQGKVRTGPEGYGEGAIQESDGDLPDGGTHGSLWGHDVTSRTYKGRYEPETGRLSIVKPPGKEYYSIPSIVMEALHAKFSHITKVVEF